MTPVTPATTSRMSPRELTLLTPEECSEVRDAVHAFRGEWTQWRPEAPFFTLGSASYLDASSRGFTYYQEKARRLNPILDSRFGWLYERLLGALSRELDAPFFYEDDLARPGFHVFLGHEIFTRPSASMHFDMQYEQIGWRRFTGADPDGQLSMTLSVRLPESGAGLWTWPLFHQDLPARPPGETKWTFSIKGLEREEHRYVEGRMVLHSGHQLHQIAPMPEMKTGEERLTLQAHALPVERGYLVYW